MSSFGGVERPRPPSAAQPPHHAHTGGRRPASASASVPGGTTLRRHSGASTAVATKSSRDAVKATTVPQHDPTIDEQCSADVDTFVRLFRQCCDDAVPSSATLEAFLLVVQSNVLGGVQCRRIAAAAHTAAPTTTLPLPPAVYRASTLIAGALFVMSSAFAHAPPPPQQPQSTDGNNAVGIPAVPPALWEFCANAHDALCEAASLMAPLFAATTTSGSGGERGSPAAVLPPVVGAFWRLLDPPCETAFVELITPRSPFDDALLNSFAFVMDSLLVVSLEAAGLTTRRRIQNALRARYAPKCDDDPSPRLPPPAWLRGRMHLKLADLVNILVACISAPPPG